MYVHMSLVFVLLILCVCTHILNVRMYIQYFIHMYICMYCMCVYIQYFIHTVHTYVLYVCVHTVLYTYVCTVCVCAYSSLCIL